MRREAVADGARHSLDMICRRYRRGGPLSLDLTTRSWSLGAKAPVPGRQEAHEFWTGSQVLVWGGGVPVDSTCCTTVKTGYRYTP